MAMMQSMPWRVVSLLVCLVGFCPRAFAETDPSKPVLVFVLAGQSNMEGQAVVDLEGKDYNDGKGTLKAVLADPDKAALFSHLKRGADGWAVRDDVWVRYQRETGPLLKGPLGVGFSVYGDRHHFGPELQFGHVVGDFCDNQVLLVKTAWGGKSLYKDFRPPSSGGQVGPYYTRMLAEVRLALENLATDFPSYGDRGYELAGLVWYQGWNDGVDPVNAVPQYEQNLVNLITDLRRDLQTPRLPVVIGELTGPWVEAPDAWATLRKAQAAAASKPEFEGSVRFVETRDFVRKPEDSPNPTHGHHEFGNAETYLLVGDALGKAMTQLLPEPLKGEHSGAPGERQTGEKSIDRVASKLFRHQYTIYDREFCGSEACVDFDNDGRRELLMASRSPGKLSQLNAADGSVRWSVALEGQQQSTSAFDLDGDGRCEALYTVSDPGALYVCDAAGKVIGQWDAGDDKLGSSPVILDADGDGVLDGYLGTRFRYLARLRMSDLTLLERREGWVQCGCHTSAMDVDGDGAWDLFAGSGDDFAAKGVLHRLDPRSLESVWSYPTNDNASSADAVLADLDGDGRVEIIKSVDNYKQDDGHDGVLAFSSDGTLLWKTAGLAGEDSPNVADLDGDGSVEIVGMTFGGEVYCLDARGRFKWRRDLRPELDDGQHMYMAPILCDLNGDRNLEILALTSGQYSPTPGLKPNAKLFALDANGEVLDELDLGESRYWGHAYVCNVDDDPYLELVAAGYGGLDVIETRGFGPDTEHFQRRRNYQRLNVRPWAYEDTFFSERGAKQGVALRADNLVLARDDGGYLPDGRFVTALLTLPPGCEFRRLHFEFDAPQGTEVRVNALDANNRLLRSGVDRGDDLRIRQPVRLAFELSTADVAKTPTLRSYSLAFDRADD